MTISRRTASKAFGVPESALNEEIFPKHPRFKSLIDNGKLYENLYNYRHLKPHETGLQTAPDKFYVYPESDQLIGINMKWFGGRRVLKEREQAAKIIFFMIILILIAWYLYSPDGFYQCLTSSSLASCYH